MKNLKTTILILSIFMTIAGCKSDHLITPEPLASFTMDKNVYVKGDTIHLNNTSTNGFSYLWVMPDGSTSISFNTDYIFIDSSNYQPLIFALEAISKDGDKKNTLSKSVVVSKLPTYTFSYGSNIERPDTNTSYGSFEGFHLMQANGQWLIYANTCNCQFNKIVEINFEGLLDSAKSGTYTLQSTTINLPIGYACAMVGLSSPNRTYTSISGEVVIIITSDTVNDNGTLHKLNYIQAIFNEIEAKDSANNILKISGNLKANWQ